LLKKITNGTLCDILNKIEVKKGDVFYIAPGTVHAIGKGILIAEIQQSSNTTFRLFDYDRKDHNGNTRELHIDEAIRVTNYEPFTPETSSHKLRKEENYSIEQLVHNDYFKVDKYDVYSSIDQCVTDCFQAILFTDGCCNIIHNNEKYKAIKGDTFFLPAGMGEYSIDGKCQFVLATV
jgi:mannose-6-phosphate isomerase